MGQCWCTNGTVCCLHFLFHLLTHSYTQRLHILTCSPLRMALANKSWKQEFLLLELNRTDWLTEVARGFYQNQTGRQRDRFCLPLFRVQCDFLKQGTRNSLPDVWGDARNHEGIPSPQDLEKSLLYFQGSIWWQKMSAWSVFLAHAPDAMAKRNTKPTLRILRQVYFMLMGTGWDHSQNSWFWFLMV